MWFHNGSLFVHGGEGPDGEETSDLHKFENGSWHRVRTSGHAPCARSGHSGTHFGNVAYVWGGLAGDVHMYVLNLMKMKWYRKAHGEGQKPTARRHHMCWFDADSSSLLWMRGGQDLDVLANQSSSEILSGAKTCTHTDDSRLEVETWCWDVRTGAWSKTEEGGFPPPPMNEGCCAQGSGQTRWAFGGYWDGWDHPVVSPKHDAAPEPVI